MKVKLKDEDVRQIMALNQDSVIIKTILNVFAQSSKAIEQTYSNIVSKYYEENKDKVEGEVTHVDLQNKEITFKDKETKEESKIVGTDGKPLNK